MHSVHLSHSHGAMLQSRPSTSSLHTECRIRFSANNKNFKTPFRTVNIQHRTSYSTETGFSHRLDVRCQGIQGPEPVFEITSEPVDKTQDDEHHKSPFRSSSEALGNSGDEPVAVAGDGNGGAGGNGSYGFGGNGGGDGDEGGDNAEENDDEEFGSLLNSEEINRQIKARGVTLPSDMAEAARTIGIRSAILSQFMDLQGSKWPLGAAIRGSSTFRNRMLADRHFLFKILTEIAIDSGCATIAEVKKRGDDFWDEFELYMADLVVGIVVDVALVSMLAPYVRFGRTVPATGMTAKWSRAIQGLPSSVFEAATPGRRFSVQQRIASYFYKGIQYGAVGFGCGIIGQGIANSIMLLKRKMKKSEEKDVPVPPLVKSAALWGVFLAASSNTRYQVVNGLERVVEGSVVAKQFPLVAMAFTVCIRFANNTYGGMQFVDWARWSGVQ